MGFEFEVENVLPGTKTRYIVIILGTLRSGTIRRNDFILISYPGENLPRRHMIVDVQANYGNVEKIDSADNSFQTSFDIRLPSAIYQKFLSGETIVPLGLTFFETSSAR